MSKEQLQVFRWLVFSVVLIAGAAWGLGYWSEAVGAWEVITAVVEAGETLAVLAGVWVWVERRGE